MVSEPPPESVTSPEISVATSTSRPVDGAAVPMPTRPDVCWTTSAVEPTVNPPVAMEEVAVVEVAVMRATVGLVDAESAPVPPSE